MTQKPPLSKGDGKVTPIRRATSHSIEAEQSVLGGLLLDNSAWPPVAEILSAEDFFRAEHRLIFQAIAELAARGDPFDLVTLGETLEAQGRLAIAGGFAYLGTLARDTPSAANVVVYARLVREKSLQRQMRTAVEQNDLARVQVLGQLYNVLTNASGKRGAIISATELLAKQFAPVRWAVPELIPEGVTILAGSPKLGKSWLGLGPGRSGGYRWRGAEPDCSGAGRCPVPRPGRPRTPPAIPLAKPIAVQLLSSCPPALCY